ncbi:MAG: tRNA pseudouridine(38-40) synthase TruA [Candidatus Lambdaproteobacteria bacterium]|nr:tRNA pseudouridine(38-40) synthase TruA [Candidatus Lambdaproteobacteria bacterium]
MEPRLSLDPAAQHGAPAVRGGAAPEAGRQNYALRLAYDGSAFRGWQVQSSGETVQGRLEQALAVILRRPVRVQGSGRTDAGVHALGQVANFFGPPGLDPGRVRTSLNALAGPAIAVQRIVPVSAGFHARHSATGKTYRYHLYNRPYPPVFARRCGWWLRMPLDVAALREAAPALLGEHDFSAFRASECAARSPVRELRRIDIAEGGWDDATLRIELEASGFLQHMARIIVGTLVAVGLGRLAPQALGPILASRRRDRADATAPGCGLHLVHVAYDLAAFPELRALEEP